MSGEYIHLLVIIYKALYKISNFSALQSNQQLTLNCDSGTWDMSLKGKPPQTSAHS